MFLFYFRKNRFFSIIPITINKQSKWGRIVLKSDLISYTKEGSLPVDVILIYNPSDLSKQQCEISICIRCMSLDSRKLSTYFLAFWKVPMSIKFNIHQPTLYTGNNKDAGITISAMRNKGLNAEDIYTHSKRKVNHLSNYPIFSLDYPAGIEASFRCSISGKINKEAYYMPMTIPSVEKSQLKHVLLTKGRKSDYKRVFELPNTYQSKPIVINPTSTCQQFYCFSLYGRPRCLQNVTITIKEAMETTCQSGKTMAYKITTYDLNDILNIPLQSGTMACFLSVVIKRQRLVPNCKLYLTTRTACTSFRPLYDELMVRGQWRQKYINYNYLSFETHFKSYRYQAFIYL